jgi:hypothetical protein
VAAGRIDAFLSSDLLNIFFIFLCLESSFLAFLQVGLDGLQQ